MYKPQFIMARVQYLLPVLTVVLEFLGGGVVVSVEDSAKFEF